MLKKLLLLYMFLTPLHIDASAFITSTSAKSSASRIKPGTNELCRFQNELYKVCSFHEYQALIHEWKRFTPEELLNTPDPETGQTGTGSFFLGTNANPIKNDDLKHPKTRSFFNNSGEGHAGYLRIFAAMIDNGALKGRVDTCYEWNFIHRLSEENHYHKIAHAAQGSASGLADEIIKTCESSKTTTPKEYSDDSVANDSGKTMQTDTVLENKSEKPKFTFRQRLQQKTSFKEATTLDHYVALSTKWRLEGHSVPEILNFSSPNVGSERSDALIYLFLLKRPGGIEKIKIFAAMVNDGALTDKMQSSDTWWLIDLMEENSPYKRIAFAAPGTVINLANEIVKDIRITTDKPKNFTKSSTSTALAEVKAVETAKDETPVKLSEIKKPSPASHITPKKILITAGVATALAFLYRYMKTKDKDLTINSSETK